MLIRFSYRVLSIIFLISTFLITQHSFASTNCSKENLINQRKIEIAAATKKAGKVSDFIKRIGHYKDLYNKSNQNFIFPAIALHGSKWANNFFTTRDYFIFQITNYQFPALDGTLSKIQRLSYGLKKINRDVFIDVISLYQTVQKNLDCGDNLTHLGLSAELVSLFELAKSNILLTDHARLEIYEHMLLHEQKFIVAPKIKQLATELNLNSMEKVLFLRPNVKFSYFPNNYSFKFNNFFNTDERILYGIMAAEIALEKGIDQVIGSPL